MRDAWGRGNEPARRTQQSTYENNPQNFALFENRRELRGETVKSTNTILFSKCSPRHTECPERKKRIRTCRKEKCSAPHLPLLFPTLARAKSETRDTLSKVSEEKKVFEKLLRLTDWLPTEPWHLQRGCGCGARREWLCWTAVLDAAVSCTNPAWFPTNASRRSPKRRFPVLRLSASPGALLTLPTSVEKARFVLRWCKWSLRNWRSVTD